MPICRKIDEWRLAASLGMFTFFIRPLVVAKDWDFSKKQQVAQSVDCRDRYFQEDPSQRICHQPCTQYSRLSKVNRDLWLMTEMRNMNPDKCLSITCQEKCESKCDWLFSNSSRILPSLPIILRHLRKTLQTVQQHPRKSRDGCESAMFICPCRHSVPIHIAVMVAELATDDEFRVSKQMYRR